MDRDVNNLWMTELLEHLGHCYDQWNTADQPQTRRFLTDAVQRDVAESRRLALARDSDVRRRLPR